VAEDSHFCLWELAKAILIKEDTHLAEAFIQVHHRLSILQILMIAPLAEFCVSDHLVQSLWYLVAASSLLNAILPQAVGFRNVAGAALHLHHLVHFPQICFVVFIAALR